MLGVKRPYDSMTLGEELKPTFRISRICEGSMLGTSILPNGSLMMTYHGAIRTNHLKQIHVATLPETNSKFAPENGWDLKTIRLPFGKANFQRLLLLVFREGFSLLPTCI